MRASAKVVDKTLTTMVAAAAGAMTITATEGAEGAAEGTSEEAITETI